jgi:hypothetical protein
MAHLYRIWRRVGAFVGILLVAVGVLAKLAAIEGSTFGSFFRKSSESCATGQLPASDRVTVCGPVEEVWLTALPPALQPPQPLLPPYPTKDLERMFEDAGTRGGKVVADAILPQLAALRSELLDHRDRIRAIEKAIDAILAQLAKQAGPQPNRAEIEALVKAFAQKLLEEEKAKTKPPEAARPDTPQLTRAEIESLVKRYVEESQNQPQGKPTPSESAKPITPPAPSTPVVAPAERFLRVTAVAPCGCSEELVLPVSGRQVDQRCRASGRMYVAWIVTTTPPTVATRAAN